MWWITCVSQSLITSSRVSCTWMPLAKAASELHHGSPITPLSYGCSSQFSLSHSLISFSLPLVCICLFHSDVPPPLPNAGKCCIQQPTECALHPVIFPLLVRRENGREDQMPRASGGQLWCLPSQHALLGDGTLHTFLAHLGSQEGIFIIHQLNKFQWAFLFLMQGFFPLPLFLAF